MRHYHIYGKEVLTFDVIEEAQDCSFFIVDFFTDVNMIRDELTSHLSLARLAEIINATSNEHRLSYKITRLPKDQSDKNVVKCHAYQDLISLCDDVISDCIAQMNMLNKMSEILREGGINVYSGLFGLDAVKKANPCGKDFINWEMPIALHDRDDLFLVYVGAKNRGLERLMGIKKQSFADTLESAADDLMLLGKQTDMNGHFHVDPLEFDSRAVELMDIRKQLISE